MKKAIVVLAAIYVFAVPAYAQACGMGGGQKGQAGCMMMEGMMPESMMQMCMPMMKQMMGQGMMMGDMMQTMMDIMKMQRKTMEGVKPAEQKEMMAEMDRMMGGMEKMMSMMGMMMGTGEPRGNLKCAEEWLHKAIDLHDVHIKDPKTATEASQMEMMEQMKKAYECITGGAKEAAPAGPEGKGTGKDPHGH